ncbi:hypothetical protein QE152_g19171 [Popillia japonica]|uniref:Uncharacterized protein n=1 Tax=Popillia japonica TaxID=7064 RepID=A0AAW1L2F8_POPJA
MRFPTGNTQLQQVEGGAMKSRTTKNTYPSISASYWQPAPTPSPYLIPGPNVDRCGTPYRSSLKTTRKLRICSGTNAKRLMAASI